MDSKFKKIAILGAHGTGNTGDEAILLGMLLSIRKNINGAIIKVISRNPNSIRYFCDVQVASSGKMNYLFDIVKTILSSDILIIGGGGILQDQTSFSNLIYYLTFILLAKLFNKKVMFYAVGVGPLLKGISKTLLKYFAKKVDFITVRDNYSKFLLSELGIQISDNHVVSDPAVRLIESSYIPKDTVLKKEKIDHAYNLIGINLRPWFFNLGGLLPINKRIYRENWMSHYKSHLNDLADCVDEFIEKNEVRFVFIPFELKQDLLVFKEFIKFIKNKEYIYLLNKKYNPLEILGFYSHLDMLIGMRLHAMIFSILSEVPFVGITYSQKTLELLKRIDYEQYSLAIESFNGNEFKAIMQMVWVQRIDLKRKLCEKGKLLISKEKSAEYLSSLLQEIK